MRRSLEHRREELIENRPEPLRLVVAPALEPSANDSLGRNLHRGARVTRRTCVFFGTCVSGSACVLISRLRTHMCAESVSRNADVWRTPARPIRRAVMDARETGESDLLWREVDEARARDG
jgi:hypothetical protein